MAIIDNIILIVLWLKPYNKLGGNNETSIRTASISNEHPENTTSIENIESEATLPKKDAASRQTYPNETFHPNLEWSDKSVQFKGSVLSYKFGEGNPSQVALLPEQYLSRDVVDAMDYVTPDVEYKLKAFLSDKNLPELLNKCVNYLNNNMQATNPDIPADQLPLILQNKDVDIENYLMIDKQTGRKTINSDIDNRMNDYLNILNNPLDQSPLFLECFGLNKAQDFEKIEDKFHELGRAFINH